MPPTQTRQDTDILTTLADNITQLCEHHHHVERYWVWTTSRHRQWRQHLTWHAPLIDQLRQAAQPHLGDDLAAGSVRGKPAPAAPANLDALDRLHAIELGVATWCQPGRGSLEADLRGLVGVAATLETPASRVELANTVDRWKLWCLTLAGWRTPPWRPNAPCPRCERLPGDKAGLRVRLDRSTACCVSCGAVWSPDVVGVLADYVRQYREAQS